MKKSKHGFRLMSGLLIFSISAVVMSCKEESLIGYSEKQSVSSEASMDSFFEDAEDISFTVSGASNTDLGGRVAGIGDERFSCATFSLSDGATTTSGTITVNFGAGCTYNGVTRKGKILITYQGERRTVGSSITVTFDGYYVNDAKIEGTRTVKVSEIGTSYIIHEITLDNGKISWPDNTVATRTAHHFRKWNWNGTPLVRLDDQISILADGSASGTNRNNKSYEMEISEDIVFKAECLKDRMFLPVSGEKILRVGDRIISVNYGSGSCDNKITVTIDGESSEVTVVRD